MCVHVNLTTVECTDSSIEILIHKLEPLSIPHRMCGWTFEIVKEVSLSYRWTLSTQHTAMLAVHLVYGWW